MATSTADEPSRVPERYQIPCGNCTYTGFQRGNVWVKAALCGLWLIVAGTVLFLAGVFVGVPVAVGLAFAGLIAAGFVVLGGTLIVHTVVQMCRDLVRKLATEETVAGA